jgi:aryl-alcohol dehydrogenase-like predicted oxidoreductase
MEYQSFEESGLRVSALCLATRMRNDGRNRHAARRERRHIFDAFIGAGGTFIDTTDDRAIFSSDNAPHPLADLITAQREHLVIASGCRLTSHIAGPQGDGSHRKAVLETLNAHLSALRTDYLDLYWIHNWDYFTPVEEVMRALAEARAAGKIRHVGIATSASWIINLANTVADWRGWPVPIAVKVPYNLVLRDIERDILTVAQSFSMPIIASSPLAGGILAGQPSQSYIGQRERAIIAQLETLSNETDCRPAQIALAWLRQRRAGGVIPLVTVNTRAQLRECLDYEACALTHDQIRRLEPNFSRPSLPPAPSEDLSSMFRTASYSSHLLRS